MTHNENIAITRATELNDQQLDNVHGGQKDNLIIWDSIIWRNEKGFTATDDLASLRSEDKEGFLLEISGVKVPLAK